MPSPKPIKGIKGFKPDLTCQGFQFKEGETFEAPRAVACQEGFHFCEYPLDVFSYYAPGESVYHEVESLGDTDSHDQDSKIATTEIHIGARISLSRMTEASVEFILSRVKKDKKKTAHQTGNQSAATNTGDWSAATNTGDWSAATNTGDWSAATNTGDRSAATNTGNRSAATNTGYRSAATNTGNQSAASVEGKDSIACGLGYQNKAKGALGCWIVLAERDNDWHIKSVKTALVDGKKIKADTWYELQNGRFVRCTVGT